jgi:hypothetical protein
VNGINFRAVKQISEITKRRAIFVSVVLVNFVDTLLQMIRINVTGGHKLDSVVLQKAFRIVSPFAAATDRSHRNPIARGDESI